MANKNTAVKVPLMSITVVRDGKRVEPKIGEPYEFTAEEAAYLSTIRGALRDSVEIVGSSSQKPTAEASPSEEGEEKPKTRKRGKAKKSAPKPAAAAPSSEEDDDL